MYYAYHSDGDRKFNSVLYVQNWFRRLEDFMSQSPLLQEVLDELSEYKYPWCDQVDFQIWVKAKYDTDWKFDPLTHHTSVILAEVKTEDTILETTLQELWVGSVSANTRYVSYICRKCMVEGDTGPITSKLMGTEHGGTLPAS